MNVLVLARWPVGGIRSYLRNVFSSPRMEGHHFTIVAPDADLSDFLGNHLASDRYHFVRARNSTAGLLVAAAATLRSGRFDLMHSQGFTAGAAGAVLSGLFHVPHLMTAHDIFRPQQFSGLRGWIGRWLLGRLFAGIDAIHAVGRDAAANMIGFFPMLEPERVHVVENGIDVDAFNAAPALDFRTAPETRGERVFLVGFFGRFMAQKGFRYLVDAVERLVGVAQLPCRLLVLTFGGGGYVREDYAMLRERGLGDYFRQMPYTDNMPGAIKGVDLVVMPSLWEACPLLGMEALVAGVPIIGTDCIGLREVLDDSPAVLVPPADAEALADSLLAAMQTDRHAEFAEYTGQAARRFSLDRHMDGLERLYRLTGAAGRTD